MHCQVLLLDKSHLMGDLIEFPNLPIYTMDDDNNNYDDDDNDYDGSLTLY